MRSLFFWRKKQTGNPQQQVTDPGAADAVAAASPTATDEPAELPARPDAVAGALRIGEWTKRLKARVGAACRPRKTRQCSEACLRPGPRPVERTRA